MQHLLFVLFFYAWYGWLLYYFPPGYFLLQVSYKLLCFWIIHSEGVFFAVKEVSLYDQGSNAKQCIFQLERVSFISFFLDSMRTSQTPP
jgi:hypothetical protein